ncbi:MAG: NAD(P)-binding domain-containing protein, partial [Gemmatimonadaceae bacterium]
MRSTTDVAVVGAGPCGLAAAIAMRDAGLGAIVFDAGCVVSSVAGYPTYMTFFSTAEKLAIGGLPFVVANEKPTRRDALAYYRAVVQHFALTVRQYERVLSVAPAGDGFLLCSRTRAVEEHATEARAVVIATGYFGTPNRL